MNCEAAQAAFSEQIDAALPEGAAGELTAHLTDCPECAKSLEALRAVGRLLRELPRKPLPAGFLTRLSAKRTAAAPPWPLPSFFPFQTAAAAACVMLVAVVVFRASRAPRPSYRPGGPAPAEVAQAPLPRSRPAPFRDTGGPVGEADKASAPVVAGLEPPAAARLSPGGGGGPAYVKAEPGFDNQAQAKRMQAESAEMGIAGVGARSEPEDEGPEPFLGRKLGTPEVRRRADASVKQLIALRHAIEDSMGRPKVVPIAGQTAPVLSQSDESNGSALGEAAGVWQGDFSGGNEGTRTILDEKAWRALWKTLHAQSPAPEIDFSRQELVAVFAGERPTGGFLVEFAGIDATESAVTVRYRELPPRPGVPAPEGATTPYALRAIPKTDLPVRFEKLK